MNLSQTALVLAQMQAYDQRTIGDADVIAWHSLLVDAPFEDCQEAVRQHYAENTERIMPAHVRRLVRDMASQREMAARATGWAPGQAGVPKDQAMPEVTGRELTSTPVAELIAQAHAALPPGSREALMPRRVAWEKEFDAYRRQQNAQPNPHYRPRTLAEMQGEPVRVGCEWHEAGGYGYVWTCRGCKGEDRTPPA